MACDADWDVRGKEDAPRQLWQAVGRRRGTRESACWNDGYSLLQVLGGCQGGGGGGCQEVIAARRLYDSPMYSRWCVQDCERPRWPHCSEPVAEGMPSSMPRGSGDTVCRRDRGPRMHATQLYLWDRICGSFVRRRENWIRAQHQQARACRSGGVGRGRKALQGRVLYRLHGISVPGVLHEYQACCMSHMLIFVTYG